MTISAAAVNVTRALVVDGKAVTSYVAPSADGAHQVDVTDTDSAGNKASASLKFTLDTAAPAAPTVTSPADTGVSATDGITKANAINVAGLEAGAKAEYSVNGGSSWTALTGTGLTLADGAYAANAVQLRQTDVAGNVSAAAKIATALTIDTAAAALTLALASDTGSSSTDGITKVGTVNVTRVEAGASWQYSVNAGRTWTAGSGTSFTLPAGSYAASAVQAQQTDVAGNLGLAGKIAGAVVVDAVAPTATLVEATGLSSTGALTYTINFSEPVTGFGIGGVAVANGTASAFATVNASQYTVAVTPSPSTTPVILTVNVPAAAASDTAGNASSAATQVLHSVLYGTAGNDILTVGAAQDLVYLGTGNDTLALTSAAGSTSAATDTVYGFGSGDKLDLRALLSGYTGSAVADTSSGFVNLQNLTVAQNSANNTTAVKFDVSFNAATISGSKISGAVIDLLYDYSKVTAIKVTNPAYNTDGDLTWSAIQQNAANGKIALVADQQTLSANPIVDASGKVASVTLTVSGLVSTFAVGLESVAAGGATAITTTNGVSTNVDVGATKIAGSTTVIGSTGTLQIVTDTGSLGTVSDNQLHLVTTYDKASDLTHLMVQYDTNAAKGTTSLSSVVAMDFGGDVTNLIPASLIFTGP